MNCKYILSIVLASGLLALPVSDSWARGGRGGGGGGRGGGGGGGGYRGGGGGGGGGYRGGGGGVSRSPSMSRPSTPSYRPSSPAAGNRPSAPATRPAAPASRPGVSQPMARPSTPSAGQRPSTLPGPGVGGGAGTSRPPVAATRPSGPGTGIGGGSRPGAPGAGISGGARPSTGDLNNFLNLPGQGASRPGVSQLPAGGNRAVADHLQNRTPGAGRVGAGIAAGAGLARVADREGMRSNLADNRGERRTERQQSRGDRADSIREGLRDHYDDHHLFDEFWGDHPHAHYRFHNNPVFWTWATWNTMAAFMPWNWGTPYYYDYGTGGNVYYEGNTVYIDQHGIPLVEYESAVSQLATDVPTVPNPDALEWLPLGVFAITKDGDPNAVPNMFLQLAVSKEGIIAGTYQNKTTGKTESVEGMVDKDNQRAAWTIVGKNTPIMETGLANLTQNEASAFMHFGPGQSQQWLMVRIEGPQAGK